MQNFVSQTFNRDSSTQDLHIRTFQQVSMLLAQGHALLHISLLAI